VISLRGKLALQKRLVGVDELERGVHPTQDLLVEALCVGLQAERRGWTISQNLSIAREISVVSRSPDADL
jgi:hypothetical protein